uniref:Uncharacterized protein TCIL3000_11_14130 n=1 Tax=Trypanosoma congolense (strain IL3000) TaxID=1068625 RepID=G0V2M6_TRYCI|nr:unnamed protein product [Trypanosoma congolense IL3000]
MPLERRPIKGDRLTSFMVVHFHMLRGLHPIPPPRVPAPFPGCCWFVESFSAVVRRVRLVHVYSNGVVPLRPGAALGFFRCGCAVSQFLFLLHHTPGLQMPPCCGSLCVPCVMCRCWAYAGLRRFARFYCHWAVTREFALTLRLLLSLLRGLHGDECPMEGSPLQAGVHNLRLVCGGIVGDYFFCRVLLLPFSVGLLLTLPCIDGLAPTPRRPPLFSHVHLVGPPVRMGVSGRRMSSAKEFIRRMTACGEITPACVPLYAG